MTAVRSFRGLGCPQQAFGIFARCAAQNTMLVIFVALWRIFFPPELISLLRLSMLRQRIRGANATSLTAASVGGISPTLLRDALNIIGVNILNWYGAVIAQSGRQFDEMSFYISTEKFGDLHLIIAKVYTSFMIVLPIA